jgi:hypothetical protein
VLSKNPNSRRKLFFTANLSNRQFNLVREIAALQEVIRIVKRAHPFDIEAMVVLPENLQAIWKYPVKHGYVNRPIDWTFSTLHRYVQTGALLEYWAIDLAFEDITVR